MKNLILINGLKRSGKDYTAELIKELTLDTSTVSFATPIKEIIADTFGISAEDLETFKNENQEYGLEIKVYPNNQPSGTIKYTDFRSVLQLFGTEAMKKQFGDNVWAKIGVENATKAGTDLVVIPDFRFMVEYEEADFEAQISGYNLYTINIFNSDLPSADAHASERELQDNNFKFDFTIDNTGQPTNIKEKVQDILNTIL